MVAVFAVERAVEKREAAVLRFIPSGVRDPFERMCSKTRALIALSDETSNDYLREGKDFSLRVRFRERSARNDNTKSLALDLTQPRGLAFQSAEIE